MSEQNTTYYLADADGYLAVTLELNPQQAAGRTELLTTAPPERPAPSGPRWQLLPDAEIAAMRWGAIRARRDKMLAASDFTQLADSPQDKHAWALYRQALRDITSQSDPIDIVWPVPPG